MTGMEPFLMAAGTGLTVVNSMQQASAAKQQGAAQAELLRRDATRKMQLAEQEAKDIARQWSALTGTRFAEHGGSGAAFSGTFSDVNREIAGEAEFQRQKILSGGADAAAKANLQARFAELKGRATARDKQFRAGAQLFKGAAATGLFGD